MDTTLLEDVLAFLKAHPEVDRRTFGERAPPRPDLGFVATLEAGRDCGERTALRVRAWMSGYATAAGSVAAEHAA